jgi:hypothetical protein
MSFAPDTATFGCRETVTVDLFVDSNAIDIRGFSLVLEFDPSVINPISVEAGALVTSSACPHFARWINASTVGDSIFVDVANLGCSTSGPGSILRMTFEGVVDGVSFLRCRDGFLRNGLNEPIDFTCDEAALTHACPVSNATRSWSTLKSTFSDPAWKAASRPSTERASPGLPD